MTRSQLIGGFATGLLMFGVLAPAVANASTDGAGASTADHARGASAFTHHAASTTPGAAHAVPLGTPISLTAISSSLLFFPQILGQVDRHR